MTIIDNPDRELVQMIVRRHALELEIKGMKRHGRSAYSICKDEYGLFGNRKKVLEEMDELIARRKGEIA